MSNKILKTIESDNAGGPQKRPSVKYLQDSQRVTNDFLQDVLDQRKQDNEPGLEQSYQNYDNPYQTRCAKCNISMLSNYLLFIIFIGMTVCYIYYCFIFSEESEPCYANHYSRTPVRYGEGRNISDRFYDILLLGSVCGIVELTRNAFHLWAKCLKLKKL